MTDIAEVVEPRVRIRELNEKDRIVINGGSLYTQYIEPASSLSDQSAQFTINIQTEKTVVDRYFLLRAYVEFTADQPFEIGTNDAPRAFPLASAQQNLEVRINGTSNSDAVSDRIHAHLCYNNSPADRVHKWSTTPAMPDSFQNLDDWTTYGSARCPLKSYAENSVETPRGGFEFVSLSVDQKTVRYVFTEPLFISPFLQSHDKNEEGMVNIRDIIITITWASDLSVMWSHSSAGQPITTLGATFYQLPEILYTQITPDLNRYIPPVQMLPYVKVDQFPIRVSPITPAGARVNNVTSNSIQIKEIPRYLMLFARRTKNETNYTTSDALAVINRVVVNWDNQSFLFNNTQPQNLFGMCVENGLSLDYTQFTKHFGSPIILEFGSQIGLKPGEAPSVIGSWTISTTIDFTNTSATNTTYDFYMCFVRHGIATFSNGSAMFSLGTLDRKDVLTAKESPQAPVEFSDLQGGGVFGKQGMIHKQARGLRQISDIAVPVSAVVAPELTPGFMAVNAISRGVERATRKRGGILSGGMPSGGMLSGGGGCGCRPCRLGRPCGS